MSAASSSPQACERVVREFLDAWMGRDLEVIARNFAPNAVYHNVPVAPIRGIEGVRKIFQTFLDLFPDARLEIISLASAPNLVIAERVDHFTLHDGRKIKLPVTGVFVLENGLIQRFSDYFDLGDWERQSGIRL
ncbi:MAG TPA: nuclear transport factor 2 family protein [Nevskiaceae bacterium]|nr:nuclear transport factor 2 family protein [Nevskiaceae bacterium]